MAAVRHECERQAQRTLDSHLARLQRHSLYPWQRADTTAVASAQAGR